MNAMDNATIKPMDTRLLTWAREMAALYESGANNQFILFGNVNDRMLVPTAAGWTVGNLRDYLLQGLMTPFDVVLSYDIGNGIRVEKGGDLFAQWVKLRKTPELPKAPQAAIETLTHYFRYTGNLARLGEKAPQVGCMLHSAELIAPAKEMGFSYETNTVALLIREWANDSLINTHAVATFLLTENINDLHPILANNIHSGKIKIPLPDAETIQQTIVFLQPRYGQALAAYAQRLELLAQQLVGAGLSAIEQLIKSAQYKKEAIQPENLVLLKKRLLEQEYGGLIGFIESKRTLDALYGCDKIKATLRQDIALWAVNDLKAMPMGYLLCGPVGTGKTFFVECLAGEAGVPVVKLKNFRDKWVGSTEGNLEKIFRLLHALGRCIVFVDEADQALGRRDATAGDSGISGRVYSMIAEEMSNTNNRGKIIWILASSRPDLIEVDLKRPGRVDVKIPLFPTLTRREGFALIQAVAKRLDLLFSDDLFASIETLIPEMLTPGAAEALTVKVYRVAKTQSLDADRALQACLQNYQLPVPQDIMTFQIDLAVREASDLEFVPKELLKR
ncbi:MAG: ATP-binding protein, partial [Desulfatitalea sp.]